MGGHILIGAEERAGRSGNRASVAFFLVLALMLGTAQFTAAQADDYGYDDGYGSSMELADPIEPVNRMIFGVNDALDMVVLRPVALAFRAVVPSPVRQGLSNFLANASSPVTFANDVLQGNADRAETTAVRFFINTVAGFGGIQDVAAQAGWVGHREDFGQTLAVWGFPSGPYIVAPILGPSTPRHLVGRAVDVLANPWTWILWDQSVIEAASPTMATIVSDREDAIELIDNVRSSSPDYYATLKNLYWQNRTSEINNGEITEESLPDIPDIR